MEWDSAPLTYNGKEQAPDATAQTGIAGENAILRVDGKQRNAGTHTATAELIYISGGRGKVSNYVLTNESKEFEILKADQTGVSAQGYSGKYDGSERHIVLSFGGTRTVAYSTDGVDWSSSNPKFKDAGDYTVYFKVTMDNHNDYPGSETVKIEPKTLSVEWGPVSLTYNGGEQAPTAKAYANVSGETAVLKVSGKKIAVGDYTATAELESVTGGKTSNYTLSNAMVEFSIGKANINTSGLSWSVPSDLVYSGAAKTVALNGAKPEGVNSMALSGETGTDAGNYAAKVTFDYDSANYNAPVFADKPWTIAPMVIRVVWGLDWFVYDGQEHILTASPDNWIEGQKPNFGVSGNKQTNAGTYPVIVTLSSVDNGKIENYVLANHTRTLTISKASIDISGLSWIVPSASDRVYDGTEKTVVLKGTEPAGVTSMTPSGNKATDAGSYTAKVEFEYDTANYKAPTFAEKKWTITPKAVSVVWGRTALTYSGIAQAPDATAETGIAGQNAVLEVSGLQTNAGTGYEATASLASVNGVVSSNYALIGKTVTFSIGRKDISQLTADPIGKMQETGSALEPGLVIKFGDTTLVKGVDYDVNYENNVSAGTATATATGKGNYEGTLPVSFEITSAPSGSGGGSALMIAGAAVAVLGVAAAGAFLFLRGRR